MQALVFNGPNKLEVANVPQPQVEAGELLIKVAACLICGTDMRIYRGKKTRGVRIPSILGHEFAGQVVQLGAGVTNFNLGDHVGVAPIIPCHTCTYCTHEKENVCANRTAIAYEYDGAFAEYVKIPATAVNGGNVFKLAKGFSLVSASLAEPLACVINGQRNAGIKLGDIVVILGAGPIGLLHLKVAQARGARHVIVSEPNDYRRKVAQKLGANQVVNPRTENLLDAVRTATNGFGADAVVMAIGVPALVQQALTLVRKGGTVNFFAGFSVGDQASIDVNLIHYNEINISGASAAKRSDVELALKMIEKGFIDANQFITHQFTLEKGCEAFDMAESGQAIKVAIIP